MKSSDIEKMMDKVGSYAEKCGQHIQAQLRAMPKEKIISLARQGNPAAQEEAMRRNLSW